MSNIFLQLALVLSLSCAFGFLMFRLKLPLVAAYLLAGVLLALLSQFDLHSLNIFSFLPELGVAFVLFLIGMELDLREIKALGKPIIMASLTQIAISTFAVYSIAGLLGFNSTASLFIGLGLSFSSTVVVIKMLLENRDLTSLYGKLSLGILLLEDLVAIVVLMAVSVGSSAFNLGFQQSMPVLILITKAAGLFILTFILSRYVLERIFDSVAKSVELLFLTAITWCFVFTSLAVVSGFSVVIGAFLAGVALASSPYHLQIEGKIKPLRDFFVTLFFVYLGSQVKTGDLSTVWPIILLLTAYALIAKPLIFLLVLGIFGFRKHTLFETSLNLSQISEFSLVLVLLGVKMGLLPESVLTIMASVAVLSIICSSVLISNSKRIYNMISPFLGFFEHSKNIHFLEVKSEAQLEEHVIVIGGHRVGGPVVEFLKKEKIPFVVLDFNPRVVERLRADHINVVYGDVADPEILQSLNLENAKLIISTATDVEDNEMLLIECRRKKVRAKILIRALDVPHARELKRLGADYVILPEVVSGDFLADQLEKSWPEIRFRGLE